MIDFHCHLDLYPNAIELLPEVSERNIFTLVVTTSPRAWQTTSRVFGRYKNIGVALGMHPEIVRKKVSEQGLLISSIAKARFIGEVGIDGVVQDQATIALQESIFTDVLVECERVGGKVISIHSRKATSRVLNIIEKHCNVSIPVLHWFSGTVTEAHRAVEMGCWFSIGPAMLNSFRSFEIINELPLNRILPETDGPFTSNGSHPLMPWEGMNITKPVASISKLTQEDVYDQMKQNLESILYISENMQGNNYIKEDIN